MRVLDTPTARASVVTLAGLVVGALTFYGQGLLPLELDGIVANSGASWSFFGFLLVAWLMPQHRWWPAIAGAGALAMEVVGYYGVAWIHLGSQHLYAPAVWLACGLLGGTVFGTAASWWRGDVLWQQITGVAVISGLWLAEGLHILLVVLHPDMNPVRGWVPVGVGLVLPLVLGRSGAARVWAFGATLVTAGVFFGLLQLIPL